MTGRVSAASSPWDEDRMYPGVDSRDILHAAFLLYRVGCYAAYERRLPQGKVIVNWNKGLIILIQPVFIVESKFFQVLCFLETTCNLGR